MPALLGRNVYRHVLLIRGHFLSADEPSELRALQTDLTGMQSVQHALVPGRNCLTGAEACAPQRRAWQPVLESLSRAILHRSG
jgi:hypothetical protein